MNNIVKRLRDLEPSEEIAGEAADLIERLQAELEATQKACEVALSRRDEADQLYLQALAACEAKDAALESCKTGVCHDPRDFDSKPGDGAQWFNKELVANALAIKPNRATLLRYAAEVLMEATDYCKNAETVNWLEDIAEQKITAANALGVPRMLPVIPPALSKSARLTINCPTT